MTPRKDHYRILGVPPDAGLKTIKARYRELARKLHPDVNKEPGAAERFREITESYQLLTDPERRGHYDAIRLLEEQRKRPAPPTAPRPEPKRRPAPKQAPARPAEAARERVAAAQRLFAQGRLHEAEEAAKALVRSHPSLGIAYAVLGDVYRAQQRWDKAARMYSLAIQFEPADPSYQRRYEQILDELQRADASTGEPPEGMLRKRQVALGIPLLLHPLFIFYVAFVPGQPARLLGIIEYWSWGLICALFLDGIVCGAVLSATGQVDRWEALGSHGGRVSGAGVYGALGALCFWVALAFYGVVGVLQDAFTPSLSRVFGWCTGLIIAFAVAVAVQQHGWQQTLMWGGNLLLLGTLLGWRVADAFRG